MAKRLSEECRRFIVYKLKNNESITVIANELEKSKSTISREIKKNRYLVINKKRPLISKENLDINKHRCEILRKPPYVCNGCPKYLKNVCTQHYVVYDAFIAQENSEYNKRNTHIKTSIKYEKIIPLLQDRLDTGQPISHILLSLDDEQKITKTTLYNLINKKILKYKKKKIKRKEGKKEKITYVNKEDFLKTKTYYDFLKYVANNPKDNVVEIDLICGNIYSKGYILSMFIPKLQFLILIKLEDKRSYSVIRALDELEKKIGKKIFKRLFGIIITDRGSEFLRYEAITDSISGGKRSKIFYCDAGKPYQKPNVENIHRLVRKVIPKGVSLERYTQEDLNFIASNINSLIKESYGNRTPNEMFLNIFSQSILKKLSLEEIPKEDVCLLEYVK